MSESTPSRPRVLVAEDDRALADVIRLAFSRANYEVTVAHDGRKALQLARSTPYRVVVSDYQMPGLNGEQFLTGVRASGESYEAILVLCSAKVFELESERLRDQLSLSAIFYKPFSLNELVIAVRQAEAALPVAVGCVSGGAATGAAVAVS